MINMKIKKAFFIAIGYILILNLINGLIWLGFYFLDANFVSHRYLITTIGKIILSILFLVFIQRINVVKTFKFSILSDNSKNYLLISAIAIGVLIAMRPFNDIVSIFDKLLGKDYTFRGPQMQVLNMEFVYKSIGAIIVAPIIEELIFRKYVLGGLLTRYNPRLSILISSICFSITHIETPLNLVPTFFVGLLAGIIYYKTKKISYAILLHFFGNLIFVFLGAFGQSYYFILYKVDFRFEYWLFVTFGILILFYSFNRLTNVKLGELLKKQFLVIMNKSKPNL
jgi:uncharacterized protein